MELNQAEIERRWRRRLDKMAAMLAPAAAPAGFGLGSARMAAASAGCSSSSSSSSSSSGGPGPLPPPPAPPPPGALRIGDRLYSGVLLTLDNCLLPEETLRFTPSRSNGLDAETEAQLRITGCELVQAAGILLRLPQVRRPPRASVRSRAVGSLRGGGYRPRGGGEGKSRER